MHKLFDEWGQQAFNPLMPGGNKTSYIHKQTCGVDLFKYWMLNTSHCVEFQSLVYMRC